MKEDLFLNKQYGLLGRKLTHSFSQRYFRQKFIAEAFLDAEFINFEINDIAELPQLIKKHPSLEGFFVTIPYKEEIIGYLNEIDSIAIAIEAVNLVICKRDDSGFQLKGYNTDVYGFRNSIEPLLTGKEVIALVLGTGGASKAVRYVLNKLGIEVIMVSRTKSNKSDTLIYKELTRPMIKSADILVNTTPLGMFPNVDSFPDLPYQYIKNGAIAFDLVYNPEKTLFLAKAEASGAKIKNGFEMLVKQAEKGWELLNQDSASN